MLPIWTWNRTERGTGNAHIWKQHISKRGFPNPRQSWILDMSIILFLNRCRMFPSSWYFRQAADLGLENVDHNPVVAVADSALAPGNCQRRFASWDNIKNYNRKHDSKSRIQSLQRLRYFFCHLHAVFFTGQRALLGLSLDDEFHGKAAQVSSLAVFNFEKKREV